MMSFDSLPRGFAPQPFAPSFPLGASASQAQGSPGGAQSPSCGSPQLPTSPQDPLSLRCRQLASSIGRDAFEHVADPAQAQPSPLGSPKRLSPERDGRGSPPGRSPGPPPAHAGLWASPHLSGTDYPLSPVGSSLFLGEISEEGEDGSAGPLGGGTVGAGGPVVGGGRPSLAHGFEYAQGESAVASSSETSTSSSAWAGNGGSFRDYVGGSFYSVSSASLGLADDEASASGGEGVTPTKSAPGRSNLTIQAASLGLTFLSHDAGLRTKLGNGTKSIKADLWLKDGDLLVGSDPTALSTNDTLSSVLLDPLRKYFSESEPAGLSPISPRERRKSLHSAPILLLLSLRSSPLEALQYILYELDALQNTITPSGRAALSRFCDNAGFNAPGLITVVCTAPDRADNDALLGEIEGMAPRHVFGAVPVADVEAGREVEPSVAPVAEAELGAASGWDGRGEIGEGAKEKVEGHIRAAHEKGLKLVYWGLPSDPDVREQVAMQLKALGVDNVVR